MAKTEAGFSTRCIHVGQEPEQLTGAVGVPIYATSTYAQDELGDVVYLDLPWDDAGSRDFKAGEHFGDIESVKATSELFSPVSGTLIAVNNQLQSAPELVNTQPYGDGWMLRVRLSDPAELDKLMDAAAYTEFLKTAGH